ncbi:MAG: hypothetical protein KGJ86_08410 [Chloroflexota bacterium]|nr:hypothetical protein [Chloroflexota bacterium]
MPALPQPCRRGPQEAGDGHDRAGQAEVGIAVAGATDVAKSAAGVVLTRQGLADIVGLIREIRRIHQRSLTYALNVSIKKFEVPVLLSIGVLAWRQFVFTPLLMALLLLANDVASMSITTDRTTPSRRPDRWDVRALLAGSLAVSVPLLALSVGVLWFGRDVWPRLDLPYLRTLIFCSAARPPSSSSASGDEHGQASPDAGCCSPRPSMWP